MNKLNIKSHPSKIKQEVGVKSAYNSSGYSYSSTTSDKLTQLDRISEEVLEVLKLRLLIECTEIPSDITLTELIKQNLELIDFKHVETKAMTRFVDDLIDMIKSDKSKCIDYFDPIYKPAVTNPEKFNKRRTIETTLARIPGTKKSSIKFHDYSKVKLSRSNTFYSPTNKLDLNSLTEEIIEQISKK